jgi:2-polyprenyl-3-methyl-5-hydroxy-6-metoxy-1,4-benzoquinol methylase
MYCPLCGYEKLIKKKIETQEKESRRAMIIFECLKCGLLFLENYRESRLYLYNGKYAAWHSSDKDNEFVAESKREAFAKQLNNIKKYLQPENKKILDVGTANGYLLEVAKKMGFDCYGLDVSDYSVSIASKKFPGRILKGTLEENFYQSNCFDVITLTDVLEHISSPHELMKEIKRILKPGGYIFIISPDSDSLSRKIMGKKWFQYKYEHVLYYNKKSLSYFLNNYDFEIKEFHGNVKKFSFHYYYHYFRKYSLPVMGNLFLFVYPLLPGFLKKLSFTNPITGEFLAVAKKQ